MSTQLEKARADTLEAAVAEVARPCRARGAPPSPQAGPPPSECLPAESYTSGVPAARPWQAGQLQPPQVSGLLPFDLTSEDCLTPSSRSGSSRDTVDWPSPRGSSGGSTSSTGSADGAEGAWAVDELGHQFPARDTLIIFDWDDTVMPTTWVKRQCMGEVPSRRCEVEPLRAELDEVAAAARESLLAAKRLGQVVVITNGERGWIERSCKRFLPTLQEVLEGVRLVSARSTYENYKRQDPEEWKTLAFEAELRRVFGGPAPDQGRRANVLSLGDSLAERQALLTSTAKLPNCRHKCLKFADRPDYLQICEQHELVSSHLEMMVHQDCDLDLELHRDDGMAHQDSDSDFELGVMTE